MKKLYWVNLFIFLIILSLSSCKTTESEDHKEIVKSAIDLAQTYVGLEEYDKALEVYNKALEEVPNYSLYYNKILVLAHSKEIQRAISLCDSVYELYPDKIDLLKAKSAFQKQIEDYNGALDTTVAILEIAKKGSEENAEALTETEKELRLDILDLLMKDNQSQKAYEEALSLWELGIFETKVIEVLYQIDNQKWLNLYNHFNKNSQSDEAK